tara:strand:+ start:658 stop:912 length:255 start_codon:yes stop_codon:yes gene_type:complete
MVARVPERFVGGVLVANSQLRWLGIGIEGEAPHYPASLSPLGRQATSVVSELLLNFRLDKHRVVCSLGVVSSLAVIPVVTPLSP